MRAVIYFTYSKRRTAEKIAKKIEGEHHEVISTKKLSRIPLISMIVLGMKTVFNKKVEIDYEKLNYDLYDEFVFVFPVWASKPAIYMTEYLKQNPIKYKKVRMIGTSDSGNTSYVVSFGENLDKTNNIMENITYKREVRMK